MSNEADSEFVFDEEEEDKAALLAGARAPWRVLVVDDDRDVHGATEIALKNDTIRGRRIEFLHAYSGKEAVEILRREQDIAVILLDVIMETPTAGLDVVPVIREELKLHKVQIVLRTGQPGQSPERDVVTRYEINSYLDKSQLTSIKLFSVLTTSVRIYESITREENGRLAIEHILEENRQFLGTTRLRAFGESSLRRMAAILGVEAEGMVCARIPLARDDYVIHIATGKFERHAGKVLRDVDDPVVRERIQRCLETKQSELNDEVSLLFFPGRRIYDGVMYLPGTVEPLAVDQHLITFICNDFAVMAENISLVADLARLHLVDSLLSIPNRTALISAIDHRLEAEGANVTMLILVDIDEFADINDMFGHQYGDRLLHAMSERLHDRLDKRCVIARIASDTFGVLGDPAWLDPKAFEAMLKKAISLEGEERQISCSIGVAYAGEGAATGIELLRNAKVALKHAKTLVRGTTVVYSAEHGESNRERASILRDLKSAIRTDQLYLMFQPQIELKTDRVAGVEALIRWRKPDGSFVPPDQFIPVAEQSGLIEQIGEWVLTRALEASKSLRDRGYGDIRMAVNVSTGQFRRSELLATINRALQGTETPPEALELEVTESIAMLGVDYFITQLNQIRKQGIEIAIDDFGTGYSSLSYLDQLPANRLKIDRSFVWALESTLPGKRIAEMVITLARRMGMRVLAEGVETQAQVDILKGYHCDEVQGYFFSKPLALSDLLRWLDARKTLVATVD